MKGYHPEHGRTAVILYCMIMDRGARERGALCSKQSGPRSQDVQFANSHFVLLDKHKVIQEIKQTPGCERDFADRDLVSY